MDLKFAKWEVSRSAVRAAPGYRRLEAHEGQNGKQGENKNLSTANEAAAAEHASGSGQ